MKQVSTVDDVKRKAEENAFELDETVELPSGLVFQIRRPKPIWWILNRAIVPASLLGKLEGSPIDQAPYDPTPEDLVASANMMTNLIESVVVSPKIRRNPKEDEVSPNYISQDDLMFILKYAGGEVSAQGQNLGDFRKQSGPAVDSTGSKAVELSSK